MILPPEPTAEQCGHHDVVVFETDKKIGYAIWYPSMGGYVSKAVAVMDVGGGGCIDVCVWHDGEFPFKENESSPVCMHHCSPEEFIEFGETLAKLNATRK